MKLLKKCGGLAGIAEGLEEQRFLAGAGRGNLFPPFQGHRENTINSGKPQC
jgi:hypothetical protein